MKKNAATVTGLLMFFALFIFSKEFSQGAATGLKNSAEIIVPSLFPFMVAASLLGDGELPLFIKKKLEPITLRLFGQPAESIFVILIGLLGGYPSGTRAAAALCGSGRINECQAKALMLFCVNAGTGFCVNAVGQSLLGSKRAGVIIFASMCLSALILGFFSKPKDVTASENNSPKSKPFSQIFVDSVASGASGILSVCAFATLFSGLIAVITKFINNRNAVIALACLLEITSGCASAAGKIPIPLIAGACAFGGLCVHMQVFSAADGIKPDILRFYIFRLVHAALASVICKVLVHFFPVAVTTSLQLSQNAQVYSFSLPAALSLLFFSSLLVLELDKQRKI